MNVSAIVDTLEKGHGHVYARKDGVRARCGGPSFCKICQNERSLTDELLAIELRCKELKQRITQYS